MGVAVGIDLGTTNSCVAIVQGDQAKIVESVYGDRIHPSVVSFHPNGDTIAGPRAKERLAIDPLNTVYSFKRLLGQQLDAPEIRHLIENLPYDVYEKNGIPVLKTRDREATLPEVSAIMLRYLREMASEAYGVEIKEAIITVPANFTDVQRASTKIAGRIAGFNVLRILNEPTAAALAYGFGGEREERIAVYDFGGGTFDITIIELLDDIFEVLSTAGDNFLGGDDLDEKIVFEMLTQFEKKFKVNLHEDPVAMQRVRSVAERAKCQLSSIDEVNATLREISKDKKGRPIDFTFSITRKRLNELIGPLVERTLATCEEALQLAKLSADDLDNVVLVGGSTRVPLVREKVAEFFNKKPRIEVNPDEVVAIGAAINAFSLTQEALDSSIKPIRKAQPLTDPFAKVTEEADNRPMGDSSGLAKTVRSSKIPPPPGKKVASGKLDDPFGAPSSPFKADNPFAKPLGKLELETKRAPMPPKSVAKKESSDANLPAVAKPKEDANANLPALKEDTWEVDLPATKEGEVDLPAAVDGNIDLPVAVEGEVDLPDTSDDNLDLQESADVIADLLTPAQSEDASLPGLPPSAKPVTSSFESGKTMIGQSISTPSEQPQPLNPEPLPSSIPVDMSEESFAEVELSFDTGESTVSSDPQEEITEEIDNFDDMMVEEASEAPEIPETPESDGSDFGDISFGDSIASADFSSEESDVFASPDAPLNIDEMSSGGNNFDAQSTTFGYAKPQHPLDEVVGEDGKEAEIEQHEAFTVPVNAAAPAVLLDVSPRGLGVATAGGYCDIIIERNAAIPIEQSRHFSTSRDNQTEVFIDVYQGESRRTEENTKLGSIELSNLREAVRGEISITVIFEIDTDGILNVKATNEETKETQSTTIKLSGGLEDEHVEALVEKYSGNDK